MSERDRTSEEPDRAEPTLQADDADPAEAGSGSDDSDEDSVRRPLIRATLELPEATSASLREPPVFTMHQQQARGAGGRTSNRNGGFARDGGQPNSSTHKKGKKRSRGGSSQQSGNRKWSPNSDNQGQHRADSGNRFLSSRRDRGRKR